MNDWDNRSTLVTPDGFQLRLWLLDRRTRLSIDSKRVPYGNHRYAIIFPI